MGCSLFTGTETLPARRVVGFHVDAQEQTERVFASVAPTPGLGHWKHLERGQRCWEQQRGDWRLNPDLVRTWHLLNPRVSAATRPRSGFLWAAQNFRSILELTIFLSAL